MGFVVKPDLVAAVANAGGIGLVPGSIGIAGACRNTSSGPVTSLTVRSA